jgi:hypothetical protein
MQIENHHLAMVVVVFWVIIIRLLVDILSHIEKKVKVCDRCHGAGEHRKPYSIDEITPCEKCRPKEHLSSLKST